MSEHLTMPLKPWEQIFPTLAPLLPQLCQKLDKLSPSLPIYELLKKRPTFTPFLSLWDYFRVLLPITILHHLSLLQIHKKDLNYLFDHLKEIAELRNMVLSYMIYDVQNRIEFNFIISDLAQENITEDQKFKQFKDNYENSDRLDGLCSLRNIEGDEKQIKLMNLYDDAKSVAKNKDKSQISQSPYETVAHIMINKCSFLLSLNSFLTNEWQGK